jgi:hypothetical protein
MDRVTCMLGWWCYGECLFVPRGAALVASMEGAGLLPQIGARPGTSRSRHSPFLSTCQSPSCLSLITQRQMTSYLSPRVMLLLDHISSLHVPADIYVAHPAQPMRLRYPYSTSSSASKKLFLSFCDFLIVKDESQAREHAKGALQSSECE